MLPDFFQTFGQYSGKDNYSKKIIQDKNDKITHDDN